MKGCGSNNLWGNYNNIDEFGKQLDAMETIEHSFPVLNLMFEQNTIYEIFSFLSNKMTHEMFEYLCL